MSLGQTLVQAEVKDAVQVIQECINEYSREVTSLVVDNDNAAQAVAKLVCERFLGMCILMLRDPGHLTDLLS